MKKEKTTRSIEKYSVAFAAASKTDRNDVTLGRT